MRRRGAGRAGFGGGADALDGGDKKACRGVAGAVPDKNAGEGGVGAGEGTAGGLFFLLYAAYGRMNAGDLRVNAAYLRMNAGD